ncbi:MAG: GDP-mannose 4,6-dehydratase [Hyphomicrobiales bacterium]|nr:GDP-mannose 4,6-dehydratase [Hyphomicrobiales bacterium]
MKRALVTGVTGQDGAYLASLLLQKGYQVTAAYRRSSSPDFWRIRELGIEDHPGLRLTELELVDLGSCMRLIEKTEPDEIYNLAAQTHVGFSFHHPMTTAHATGLGPLHFLEAVRNIDRGIRYYQASSAEMFGKVQAVPQNELTPFYPRSPYGVSKLFAHWMTVNYRESYGLFGCSGILFNHESPLRGFEFVTRKITDGVARIRLNNAGPIELGNLCAKRDWGYAREYVEGMWRMMQADKPDTYVLATNRTETVRDFATMAFAAAGMDVEWAGRDEKERGLCPKTGRELVRINPDFYRAAEVDLLKGDASKARKLLGWKPETTLEQLCAIMVSADLERVDRELAFRRAGTRSRRNLARINGYPPAQASSAAPEAALLSPTQAPTLAPTR